jgi:uncharacterized protein
MTEDKQENILAIDANGFETTEESAYPDVKSTIILFFIFILNSVIVAIPALIFTIGAGSLNSILLKSSLKLLLYCAPLLITFKYVIRKSKEQQGYFSRISFNRIQLWLVPILIIAALAMVIPLAQISAWIPMPKSIQKLFEGTFTKDTVSIVIAIIIAPMLEEILCRGVVLSGLLKNYAPYKAILVSAIFFGAIHLNPWQGIPVFFSGLFLGWIYYKTQSVIPGMVVHATINIAASLTLFLPGYQQRLSNFSAKSYYPISCIASLMVFAAICLIIQRKISTPRGQLISNRTHLL